MVLSALHGGGMHGECGPERHEPGVDAFRRGRRGQQAVHPPGSGRRICQCLEPDGGLAGGSAVQPPGIPCVHPDLSGGGPGSSAGAGNERFCPGTLPDQGPCGQVPGGLAALYYLRFFRGWIPGMPVECSGKGLCVPWHAEAAGGVPGVSGCQLEAAHPLYQGRRRRGGRGVQ